MAKMFRRGSPIREITALVAAIDAQQYIYYRGRLLHPLFVRNMSFGTVLSGLHGGRFVAAVRRVQQ